MNIRILLVGFENPPETKHNEIINVIKIRKRKGLNVYAGENFRIPVEDSAKFYSSGPTLIKGVYFRPDLPTIYDYHIVVVSKEAILFLKEELQKKKGDFLYLMMASFGGTLVVPIIDETNGYKNWIPAPYPLLTKAEGESIIWNEKHWMYSVMKKYERDFTWRAHHDAYVKEYDETEGESYIATNIAGNPISFEWGSRNGRIVYLPFYNFATEQEETTFLRELLNKIEEHSGITQQEPIPFWASKPDYRFGIEDSIDKQVQTLIDKSRNLNHVKSILWLGGTQLADSIAFTMKVLGINCEMTENEGKHDIEIKETELHAVVEVKGLSTYADVKDLR